MVLSITDLSVNQGGSLKAYKIFKLVAPIFALVLTINTASASFLLEPHVAYNLSGSGDGDISSVNHEYSYNGPQFGARFGYQGLGLMTGFDYTRSSFDLKDKASGVETTRSLDRNEFGFFVGYEFPILLRAWGTYYFVNSAEDSAGSKYSGNTKELGVGFTALPLLSVNLMYRLVSLDEVNSSAIGSDINISEIVIGVSLPLNF